jgi:hypothetical protein
MPLMIGLPVGVAAALLILLAALWKRPVILHVTSQATAVDRSTGVTPAINNVEGDQDENTTETQDNGSNNITQIAETNAHDPL